MQGGSISHPVLGVAGHDLTPLCGDFVNPAKPYSWRLSEGFGTVDVVVDEPGKAGGVDRVGQAVAGDGGGNGTGSWSGNHDIAVSDGRGTCQAEGDVPLHDVHGPEETGLAVAILGRIGCCRREMQPEGLGEQGCLGYEARRGEDLAPLEAGEGLRSRQSSDLGTERLEERWAPVLTARYMAKT